MRTRFSDVLFACSVAAAHLFAQATRPEAGPFDASRMTMQTPPPPGVAVRAGRLFDSKAGVMLTDQVIVVKGDLITPILGADRCNKLIDTTMNLERLMSVRDLRALLQRS